jgi:uracil-DNA glycosylase family 4
VQTRRAALARLQKSQLDCRRCGALVQCRSRVVPGNGAADALIAFVGLAPGRRGGDRTGIPFSGDRSGELLRAMIRMTGLQRVFITNLVRCNPRDAQGRNRDPTAVEIANCRDFLEAELELVRPQIVVCLGRTAWREMAGPKHAFSPAKAVMIVRRGVRIYPMYHPAYVNRGAYPLEAYARDFRRLAALLNAEPGHSGPVRAADISLNNGQLTTTPRAAMLKM